MPINKNANIRYRVLDRCFRDKRHRYFIEDLIDECDEALRELNDIGKTKIRDMTEKLAEDAKLQVAGQALLRDAMGSWRREKRDL